jgi:hypothetical protein
MGLPSVAKATVMLMVMDGLKAVPFNKVTGSRDDTDRRVGSATTPLKPKEGLNGPPKLCLVISSLNLPQAS